MALLTSGFDVPDLAACPLNCERNPFSLKLLLRRVIFFSTAMGKKSRQLVQAFPVPCVAVWAVKQREQIGMHHCGPGKTTLKGNNTEFLSPTRNANPDEALSFRTMESTRLSIHGSFSSCLY